jgi:hypothetical protein
MQSVSVRSRHAGVLLALILILAVPTANAGPRRAAARWPDGFQRAKRLIVTLLGRLTPPPGEPVSDTTTKTPGDSLVSSQE